MKTKKLLLILILIINTCTFAILNRRVDLGSPEGGIVTIFHDVHQCHNKDIIQEQVAACSRIIATNPLIHIENSFNAKQTDFCEKLKKLVKQDSIEILRELSKVIWKNEPNDKIFITDPRANFFLFCEAYVAVELIRKKITDRSLQDAFIKKLIETYDISKPKLLDCLGELKAKMVANVEKFNPDLFSVELAELKEFYASFMYILDQYQDLLTTEQAQVGSSYFRNCLTASFPMVDLLRRIKRTIVSLIEFDYYDFVLHHSRERIYIFTGGRHGINLEVMLVKAGFKIIYETCAKNYYISQGSGFNADLFLARVPHLTSEQILHGLE